MTGSYDFLKPSDSPNALAVKVDELRSVLRSSDPLLIADRCGCIFDQGSFHLSLFERPIMIPFSDLVPLNEDGSPFPVYNQAMIFYYLTTADGSPLANQWVSFADLPGGRTYSVAYQGYSGDKLLKAIGENQEMFVQACMDCGGKPGPIGDTSFIFAGLPRTPLLVSCWWGDEDFPSSCKILFDASACHYLPIDACAILGSMLTSRLIKTLSSLSSLPARKDGLL